MKPIKDLSQDSHSLGRDLNPRPPRYEAGVPTCDPHLCTNLATDALVLSLSKRVRNELGQVYFMLRPWPSWMCCCAVWYDLLPGRKRPFS
jgi:hypothetical protein